MSTTEFSRKLVELQDEMWRFAYSLSADYDDACDLLQETSLKALLNRQQFVDDTNFKGWICTIMHNLFISHQRQAEHRSSLVEPLPDDLFSSAWDERCVQSDSFLDANDCQEIKQLFQRIPLEERQVFSYFVVGYKYREIAEAMHLSVGTVKNRIFCIRHRLQKLLRDFVN